MTPRPSLARARRLAAALLLAAAPAFAQSFGGPMPDIKGEMKRHEAEKQKARKAAEARNAPCDPSKPACKCKGKSLRIRLFKKAKTDFTGRIEAYAEAVLATHGIKLDKLLTGVITDHEVDSANTLCEMVWKGLTKDAALRNKPDAARYKTMPEGIDTAGTVWVFLTQVGSGFQGVSEGGLVAGKLFHGLTMCKNIDVALPDGLKVAVIDYNPEKPCPNALIHELGHAAGLDDLYGLEVKNAMLSASCPKMPTVDNPLEDLYRYSEEQIATVCKSPFLHAEQSPDDYPAPAKAK